MRASDLEKAAQTAIESLRALGYQDMHFDLAVKGVCAECAGAKATPKLVGASA